MSPQAGQDEDRIDELLIADADDPEAWEAPIVVAPSGSPRPLWAERSKHLELASRFYVMSVLHRLGAEASLSLAQPDNVDITVVRESGDALTVDVKTLAGTRHWPVEQFRARERHFVVFVCYAKPADYPASPPAVYILSSQRLKQHLAGSSSNRLSLDVLSDSLDDWSQLTASPAA